MTLDDSAFVSIRKTTQFPMTSIASNLTYLRTGEHLAVSFPDQIQIYNCLKPNLISKINVQNQHSEFLFKNAMLLTNRNKINYVSLHDTTLKRTFTVKDKIKSINSNYYSDLFLASADAAYIFDLKSKDPLFKIDISNSTSTFISENEFVILNSSLLRVFDCRQIRGPKETIPFANCEKIKFINNANKYLLETNKNTILVLDDSFNTINEFLMDDSRRYDVTSDGNFIAVIINGFLKIANVDTNYEVLNIVDDDVMKSCIAFNPGYAQFATCNERLRFWMPNSNFN